MRQFVYFEYIRHFVYIQNMHLGVLSSYVRSIVFLGGVIIAMASMGRTPEQIGALIRLHRKRLGLSQAALGMRTGLRQATVSLMESGNPACRLDTLLAVLSALDLELQIGARTRNRDLADLVD